MADKKFVKPKGKSAPKGKFDPKDYFKKKREDSAKKREDDLREFFKKKGDKSAPMPTPKFKDEFKRKQGITSPKPFETRNPIAKKKKKKPLGKKGGKGTPVRTDKPGVPHGVDKKDQEGNTIIEVAKGGSVSKFPDLSGDGKVTQKDILMGRGVIKAAKGGLAGRLATRGYGKARK